MQRTLGAFEYFSDSLEFFETEKARIKFLGSHFFDYGHVMFDV